MYKLFCCGSLLVQPLSSERSFDRKGFTSVSSWTCRHTSEAGAEIELMFPAKKQYFDRSISKIWVAGILHCLELLTTLAYYVGERKKKRVRTYPILSGSNNLATYTKSMTAQHVIATPLQPIISCALLPSKFKPRGRCSSPHWAQLAPIHVNSGGYCRGASCDNNAVHPFVLRRRYTPDRPSVGPESNGEVFIAADQGRRLARGSSR